MFRISFCNRLSILVSLFFKHQKVYNMEDGISNSSPRFHIRKMLPQETSQAVDIFGQHGLHEGRHSVVSFLQIDPNAFYVAVNDDNDGMLNECYLKQ